MRAIAIALFVTALGLAGAAQSAVPPVPSANAPSPAAGLSPALASDLDRLQSAASQANLEIGHIRIDKWKTDAGSKQQAQANADSLQRNLTTALPGLIDNFRAAPQDLNAGFKLYRNLNALYDVFASFTESAGAFGSRNEYEELVQPLSVIDSVRHNLGDDLEKRTASNESELNQLRAQVRSLQQAAVAAPPKKVIVDDTEPEKKKTTHKKKPATTDSTNSGSSNASTPAAKSQ